MWRESGGIFFSWYLPQNRGNIHKREVDAEVFYILFQAFLNEWSLLVYIVFYVKIGYELLFTTS